MSPKSNPHLNDDETLPINYPVRGEQSAQSMACAIMNDPGASYWLKNAVNSLMRRDCVDALCDAETLVKLMEKVCADPMHTSV